MAHALATRGERDVTIVDERAPLTLTSAMSTECYRDWWPGPDPAMAQLMTRSIDLLEQLADESGNAFRMNRRGYVFATADAARAAQWRRDAQQAAAHGIGPLRTHEAGASGYVASPASGVDRALRGIDLVSGRALIARHFPYLSERTVAVLHARRCGWLSAQQLGMYLLERARDAGARVVRGRVRGIDVVDGRARRASIDEGSIAFDRVVIAAGPGTRGVASTLGVGLPIECEPHLKVAFHDRLAAVPRDAPFLIWSDPQRLEWTEDQRRELRAGGAASLADDDLPAGAHGRPEGDGDAVLMLWGYATSGVETLDRPDPRTAEIVLRGWSAMLPALRAYFGRLPKAAIDGGYYARTRENRPLIGPLPVRGAYVVGALSGFGIMSALGAADLAARHIHAERLPPYAPAFLLERYDDPAYRERLPEMVVGQL